MAKEFKSKNRKKKRNFKNRQTSKQTTVIFLILYSQHLIFQTFKHFWLNIDQSKLLKHQQLSS